MTTEPSLIGMEDGYYQDGAPVDVDNKPAASEGYNARRFGNARGDVPGMISGPNGEPVDPNADPTDVMLNTIFPEDDRD